MTDAATHHPLRIGIDARKLGDFGIGDYLAFLIAGLAEADTRNDYVLLHGDGTPALPVRDGMRWRRSDAPKYSLREQAALPWHAWRERLDVLHCPHYAAPLATPCPLVVTVHDVIHLVFPQHRSRAALLYARAMLAGVARRAAHVITVSQASRADLVERVGLPAERITVIPNGLAPDARPVTDPAVLDEVRRAYALDRPFLLYAGNLRMKHKNVETLLRAYRLLCEHRADPPLLVLAGGDPPDWLRTGIADMLGPYATNVRLTGFVPRAHLIALYTLAVVFQWPSLYEGFGLPPLEAMACGTPVVSSNASAMPEVLGDAAMLVPPTEPEAFADATARLLDDAALHARLTVAGQERAAHYSWSEHARHTLAVYERVAQDA